MKEANDKKAKRKEISRVIEMEKNKINEKKLPIFDYVCVSRKWLKERTRQFNRISTQCNLMWIYEHMNNVHWTSAYVKTNILLNVKILCTLNEWNWQVWVFSNPSFLLRFRLPFHRLYECAKILRLLYEIAASTFWCLHFKLNEYFAIIIDIYEAKSSFFLLPPRNCRWFSINYHKIANNSFGIILFSTSSYFLRCISNAANHIKFQTAATTFSYWKVPPVK